MHIHELNSSSLVRLMKSSTFGLGLRSSLNDVTAAIYETAAILVHKEEQILWELNSLLSFVARNLHSRWPRERKRSIIWFSFLFYFFTTINSKLKETGENCERRFNQFWALSSSMCQRKINKIGPTSSATGLNKWFLPYSVLLLTAALSIFKLFSL